MPLNMTPKKKKNRGVVKLGRFVRRCDLEIQCNFPIKIKLFPFSFLFQDLAPEGFGFQSENWWMVFYISVALGCLFYLSFLSFVVKVALPQNLFLLFAERHLVFQFGQNGGGGHHKSR